MLTLTTDIRRFRDTGALPWGPAQADQDAYFWDAVDVVAAAQREVAEHLKKAPGAGNGS